MTVRDTDSKDSDVRDARDEARIVGDKTSALRPELRPELRATVERIVARNQAGLRYLAEH